MRWRLGVPGQIGLLGVSSTLGAHAWAAQQKFRVVLGPLNRVQFQRMLPGGASLKRLRAIVRSYTGDEFRWDVTAGRVMDVYRASIEHRRCASA